MQIQHRVHAQELTPVLWPRCSKVEIKDELIQCDLALDRQYDFVEAYSKTPHIRFMNCNGIDDVKAFIWAWGPLHLVFTAENDELRSGRAIRRLDEWLAHRRWLRALRGMIDACRGRNDERGALAEFLAAEGDLDLTSNTYVLGQAPLFHTILNQQFGYAGDSIAWVASARNNAVNEALCFSVEMNVRAPVGCLRVERKKGKSCKITPGFFLPTLWDALLWMIWQDESNGWPPPACRECHRIFPRSSAHERKYCSGVCAHRVTNREWRRKDLLQRKNTRKSIEAGGKHGPGKAR